MSDVVVRLRPDQVERLDRFAAQDGRSRSNAVQRAVDLLLERQQPAADVRER
jgi:predicted transcriptional regulator